MTVPNTLAPLPYHRAVCDYLQTHEAGLWGWLGSPQAQQQLAGTVALELLKNAYRLDSATHPAVYASVERCRVTLNLEVPVTVYQSQGAGAELNAMLLFDPDHAHVMLSGPVLDTLSHAEVRAVIAHELAHHVLWSADEGDFFTAWRVLSAMAQTSREPAHANTESRFSRYTELFCDRAGLLVCQDRDVVVSALVKMSTGITEVSAKAYLQQVAELLEADSSTQSAEGLSHPELFVRARALEVWEAHQPSADPARVDAALEAIVSGPLDWDGLDVLDQQRLEALTRSLVARAICPPWVKSMEAVVAHARLFWTDADLPPSGPTGPSDADSASLVDGLAEPVIDYLAFVLVDLLAVVGELDETLLAWLMTVADEAGLGARFDHHVNKELRVTKKVLSQVRRERERLVDKATRGAAGTDAAKGSQ